LPAILHSASALLSGQTSVVWRMERQIYYKEWRALGMLNTMLNTHNTTTFHAEIDVFEKEHISAMLKLIFLTRTHSRNAGWH
jgi:hypothetical protein